MRATSLVMAIGLSCLSTAMAAACAPRAPAKLRLEVPELAELDPTAREDASEVHITVRDVSTNLERSWTFPLREGEELVFETLRWGGDADVHVDVLSSLRGAVIGHGRAYGALSEDGELVVPVRKLIAYAADAGGRATVRVVEVRPGDSETVGNLDELGELVDVEQAWLAVTDDGRRLVAAGVGPNVPGTGRVAVYRTLDHEVELALTLQQRVDGLAAVPASEQVIALPADDNTVQLIDVGSGEIEDVVLFDDASGRLTFDGNAVVVSDDGRAAYIAGDLNGDGEDAARVFRVELADRSVTFHANPILEEYTGARLAADGQLYLSGVTCRDDVCRSLIERCHPVFLACEELTWLEDGPVIAERLTLAPDGEHLLVQRTWLSGEPDGGGAGLDILDLNGRTLESHERSVTSAVRLPDGRTLGGLPYFANDNEAPELTWIGGPGDWFPEGGDGSVESFFGALDVTAIFGDQL